MKQKLINLPVLLKLLVLVSCNVNKSYHDCKYDCEDIIVINLSRDNMIGFKPGQFFKSFEFILLEERKDASVGTIKKIIVHDSLIFILDDTRKVLQKFSNKGEYLRQIGSIGRAPGEYLQLLDFQVDDDNTLFLWDYRQKKMISYDFYGTFKMELSINDYFLSFVRLKNDYWCYTAGINDENSGKKGFNLRQFKGDINSNTFIDYFPASCFYPRILNKTNFFKYGNNAIFAFGLSNIIYRVSDIGIQPYICIDAGKQSIPYNIIKDQFKNMQECGNHINNNDFIGMITDCLESERYVFFNTKETKTGNTIQTIYDKKNMESTSFMEVINDNSNIVVSGHPIFIDDEFFYYVLPPYYFDNPNIKDFIYKYSISENHDISDYSTVLIRAKIKDSKR